MQTFIIILAAFLASFLTGYSIFVFINSKNEKSSESLYDRTTRIEKILHNEKFERYAGERIEGAKIYDLLDEITYNVLTDNILNMSVPSLTGIIPVKGGNTSAKIFKKREEYLETIANARRFNRIGYNNLYKVVIEINKETGLVKNIDISDIENLKDEINIEAETIDEIEE